MENKLSAFQSAQNKSTEIVEQAAANLEKLGSLTEIHKELQTAIRDKIDLSKSKLSELRLEVQSMVQEVESFGKLAVAFPSFYPHIHNHYELWLTRRQILH